MTLVSAYAGRAAEGASVRDARTGEITDLVRPPAGEQFRLITSYGDGTYILTASGPQTRTRAYRLRVGAAGRVAELAPLPVDLLPPECRSIAASPGETALAYTAWDVGPPAQTAAAGLVYVATGDRRLTSVPPGVIRYLTLANDGQTVAFQFESRTDVPSGVYVAATAAPDWVQQGRLLDYPEWQPCDAISPVIGADGRMVYLTIAQPGPASRPHWNRLLEIPAAGGLPRVIFELRYQDNPYNVSYTWTRVCRDPGGRSLLAFATSRVYRIEISSGATAQLPFLEGQPYDAAW